MVTVHRAFGFRFVIFTNDHSPPHVHVVGAEGEAKLLLGGPSGVAVDWVIGIGRADMRRILRVALDEKEHLLEAWRTIHG